MNPLDSYEQAQQWAALAPFIWVGSIIFGILLLWALIVVIFAGTRYLNRTTPDRGWKTDSKGRRVAE